MTTARSFRSSAVPAGRGRESGQKPISARPELHVVSTHHDPVSVSERFHSVLAWTRSRHSPLLHMVLAGAFLVSSLLASLVMTTQMVQNSFEETKVKSNIAKLSQDVDDDQAKLDDLQASLPTKAKQMGMVPQQGSISIDLNGYQPAQGGTS